MIDLGQLRRKLQLTASVDTLRKLHDSLETLLQGRSVEDQQLMLLILERLVIGGIGHKCTIKFGQNTWNGEKCCICGVPLEQVGQAVWIISRLENTSVMLCLCEKHAQQTYEVDVDLLTGGFTSKIGLPKSETMKQSSYLEQRAAQGKRMFEALTLWNPPDFRDLSSNTVKRAILSGTGEVILAEMLREHALGLHEAKVLEALSYSRTVFDNSEVADAGHGTAERIFTNIYDLLLASARVHSDSTGSSSVYRGQYSGRWGLVASYYRSVPRRQDYLWPSARQGQLEYLRKKYRGVDFDKLNELQQDAVIQHYLSGTQLLDFTRSIYVAAFFATGSYEDKGDSAPDTGAIYRISPHDVQENLEIAKVEAPELPTEFRRIHRQEGVFLKPLYPSLLDEPGLFDRWAFYHTAASRTFESKECGVSREWLLPEEVTSNPNSE